MTAPSQIAALSSSETSWGAALGNAASEEDRRAGSPPVRSAGFSIDGFRPARGIYGTRFVCARVAPCKNAALDENPGN